MTLRNVQHCADCYEKHLDVRGSSITGVLVVGFRLIRYEVAGGDEVGRVGQIVGQFGSCRIGELRDTKTQGLSYD